MRWQSALAYLDDIVMYLKSPRNYIEQSRIMLQLQCKADAILELNKRKVCAQTFDNRAHVILHVHL